MSAGDVMMAYSNACRDLTHKEEAALAAKGVPESAIGFDAAGGHFRLRGVPVFWEGPLFQIGAGGQHCIAIVCRDERGDVADIAAWSPQDDKLGLWMGNVSMLGEETCLRPRLSEDKLWVRDGVLDWLVHRRTGIVIVSPDRARAALVAASPLAVKTQRRKADLERMWKPPRIQVFEVGVAEATMDAV